MFSSPEIEIGFLWCGGLLTAPGGRRSRSDPPPLGRVALVVLGNHRLVQLGIVADDRADGPIAGHPGRLLLADRLPETGRRIARGVAGGRRLAALDWLHAGAVGLCPGFLGLGLGL